MDGVSSWRDDKFKTNNLFKCICGNKGKIMLVVTHFQLKNPLLHIESPNVRTLSFGPLVVASTFNLILYRINHNVTQDGKGFKLIT